MNTVQAHGFIMLPSRHPRVVARVTRWQQYQIFKISYFHKFYYYFDKNFLSPNIPKNHKTIAKKAQTIDMWDEWKDSWTA